MVCETPRLRSLLVSRRGGFLEDPFFRDAWGDYNNAVRRIVDRFNHGMFAPRDRLRDSHYHSMYRTLRSARINYAAQSARFKDEGDLYKLVMDVREFVGGDLTVRTAGGTVSVRGRVETNDNESTHSGSSRASRTLHRRFNLPPDADGERVESALSRDAVLTVTIPKRKDVRVIPVTMEGDSGSESGRSATKRHSASHPDPGPTPRKRTQEDSSAPREGRERSSSRGRTSFGFGEESRRDQEEQDLRRSRERSRRRGSELYSSTSPSKADKDVRRRSYPESSKREYTVNIQRSNKGEGNGSKRRNQDIAEEDETPGVRGRQRSSKYEEAREINIPIRVESSGDSESVFPYPASRGEKVAENSEEVARENGTKQEPSTPPGASKNTQPERKFYFSEGKEITRSPESSRVNSNIGEEKENIKPDTGDRWWKYSKAYQTKPSSEDTMAEESPSKVTKTLKTPDTEPKRYYFGDKPMKEVEVRVVSPDEPRTPEISKNGRKIKIEEDEGCENDAKVINKENTEDYNSFLQTKSQETGSPSSGSKSPLIGREVKVEKKQSDMEGDMFNDCWQNFSSTLQDVLSRLQELSAELGHARALVTPSSPPTSAEVADNEKKSDNRKTPEKRSPDAKEKKVPSKGSPSGNTEYRIPVSVEGRERVSGEATAASGVGVGSSTTPPTVYASEGSPHRAGFAGAGAKCHKDYQSTGRQRDKRTNHAVERDQENTPQMQQVSSPRTAEDLAGVPCRRDFGGGCGGGGARARDNIRPTSFVLGDPPHSDAVHVPMSFVLDSPSENLRSQGFGNQRNGGTPPGPRPRPTSLDINHESALLRDLRKESPVDALKDHFLKRMTPTSESPSVDTGVHYIPVELEASKTVATSSSVHGAKSSQSTRASGIPLCERRGKDIENLVIKDDSSDVSSRVSVDVSDDKSSSVSTASSRDHDEQPGSWAEPGHATTHKPTTGNSSVLNIGPDPFQQHSSSVCGGADSRAQPDGISGGSATGGSRTQPCPRLPSESDLDVDEIISKAERVIEETRRLSADIANTCPPENDLGWEGKNRGKRETAKDTSKLRGFNLAPNIDTRCSPESNFIEEQDEEYENSRSKSEEPDVVVEGCLSIPLPRATSRPRQPRITPPSEYNVTPSDTNASPEPARRDSLVIEAVDDVDDVTPCEEVRPTIVTSPEIQSSDVMVCARESGRRGRTEAPPSPKEARPRTLAHETQPTREPRRPSSRERMGGVFSRGRADESTRQPPAASGATRHKTVSPPPQTPPTPTRRQRERSFTPQEEQPPPPYVRQKAEPSRRYSGFGHVQSDNVRKMRDVWSSKQETSPQPPQRGIRVPASPPPSGRRAPDSPKRSSFSRSTPTRDSPLRSPTRTNNFYSSTISSRNKTSSSPRRGSTSSTDGGASSTPDASRNTSAAANSSRAPHDKYNLGGRPGERRASPVRTPRTTRRTATPPPPPPPSEPPPASPFYHKVFRRLRDASLQPDSETICFSEEEDRYKLVMDVEEYVPGEIEVLQDDKNLTVKGRVETKQGSSTSTRTFCRHFHIPRNSREEDIDSALSKDGILTVYVPKKRERVIKIELTD